MSLVPTAKCGLSSVGPCHMRSLSTPPPPRRVGAYGMRRPPLACATPACIRICPAIGSESPAAPRMRMNRRRESAPCLTLATNDRSSSSSMPTSSAPAGYHFLSLLFLAGCSVFAPAPGSDVPFVSTPDRVVERMLQLAKVGPEDVVYDLGSGDGRIVIAAARKHGARGVGIDIDPQRVKEGSDNARRAGVAERVEFREGDLFKADISDATVVTLYLMTGVNLRLRPKLLNELKPGTRVVSHAFGMGDWKPAAIERVGTTTLYYWVVPERKQNIDRSNSGRLP